MANKSSGRIRKTRRGVEGIDVARPGSVQVGKPSPLETIPDKVLRDQQRAVISKMFKRYGFEADTVAMASLPGAYGVNVQGLGADGINQVYLSKGAYKSASKIREAKVSAYKSGWSVKTKNPLQHTLVHELAHSKWISEKDQGGIKKKIQPLWEAYQKEVESKMKKYGRDGYAKYLSIGQYAATNINEFWAEASTQYHIGAKKTKYSKAVGKIWESTFAKSGGKAAARAGGRGSNPGAIPGLTTIKGAGASKVRAKGKAKRAAPGLIPKKISPAKARQQLNTIGAKIQGIRSSGLTAKNRAQLKKLTERQKALRAVVKAVGSAIKTA